MLFCQCRAVYDRRCTMDEGQWLLRTHHEIRDNITRVRRDFRSPAWYARRRPLVQRNTLGPKPVWFWPDRRCAPLQKNKTDECNVWNTSNACSCNGYLADGWNRTGRRSIHAHFLGFQGWRVAAKENGRRL